MLDPFPFARPLLHAIDPEAAHELTLRALEWGIVPGRSPAADPALRVHAFGRSYAHPVGLAAGFDKNARVFHRLAAHGFSFVEIGGVTPRPQAGNARPRVFRLPAERGVINRMGFPNDGAEVVAERVHARGRGLIPLWVNLASNADAIDPVDDFRRLVVRFAPLADVLTLDISCPNTANGQVFLEPGPLAELLAATRSALPASGAPAVVAKVGPDIAEAALEAIVATLLSGGIDGIVATNTTRSRAGVVSAAAAQAGGLSGAPLAAPSTAVLGHIARLTAGRVTLVGVGGVASAADAYAKIRAGATLVQLYTALIYQGTALLPRIARDLSALVRRDGFTSIAEAIGADLR